MTERAHGMLLGRTLTGGTVRLGDATRDEHERSAVQAQRDGGVGLILVRANDVVFDEGIDPDAVDQCAYWDDGLGDSVVPCWVVGEAATS